MWIWIKNTAFLFANLRMCNFWTGTPKKFADLRFADQSLQICGFAIQGLAHIRSLRICDCGINPRVFGFAMCRPITKFSCPSLCGGKGFFPSIIIAEIEERPH